MTILHGLLITAIFMAHIPRSLAGLLESGFVATYEVSHNDFYLGDSVRRLTRKDAQTWVYHSKTQPKGIASAFVSDIIDETSAIKINAGELYPLIYKYHQHGGKEESKFSLQFNWKNHLLTNSDNNKTYPLKANAQDLLSFQLQLMRDLTSGKTSMAYMIADKHHFETYQLKAKNKDQVETPMKEFTAIKLVSNKIRDTMQFIIWCAPELGYLPVKVMKIEEDGDRSVLTLKSLTLK
jgi:hypothetical protein